MIKEISVDCAFVDQIAEAHEQENYYLKELNSDPTNEYLAKKFCLYHSIVESLQWLEGLYDEKQTETFKNF
jgi:hypothetical protein